MNNADKPAYPVHGSENDDPRNNIIQGGLTKRELFAIAAMQGMISTYERDDVMNYPEFARTAQSAVAYADELLKQLES